MFLSLPVFIYVCYLLVRLSLKYLDKEAAAETASEAGAEAGAGE